MTCKSISASFKEKPNGSLTQQQKQKYLIVSKGNVSFNVSFGITVRGVKFDISPKVRNEPLGLREVRAHHDQIELSH